MSGPIPDDDSTEPEPAEGERTEEQSSEDTKLDALLASAEWDELAAIAGATVAGLFVTAILASTLTGATLSGIARGVLYLTPVSALAAMMFHHYDPVNLPFVGPLFLFLSLLAANTLTLSVKVFRMFGAGDALAYVLVAFVALSFSVLPTLFVWATRRFYLGVR